MKIEYLIYYTEGNYRALKEIVVACNEEEALSIFKSEHESDRIVRRVERY